MSGPARRRSVRSAARLATTSPGGGFDEATSLNAAAVGDHLSPFVDLTAFAMSQPVFRPHPHAGFSAVTYMLESSDGAFRNRWSAGPDELIGPGALHWTRAGSGMVHEEVPVVPGTVCRGVQMFVKLPPDREEDDPRAFHLDADEVPELHPRPGVRIRHLTGELDGSPSPLGLPDAVTLLDVHLDAGATVELAAPASWNAWAFVLAGTVDLGAGAHDAPAAATYADDGDLVVLTARTTSQLLFGAGPPAGPMVARGSFILSSAERLAAAERRFAAGSMGRLTPSF